MRKYLIFILSCILACSCSDKHEMQSGVEEYYFANMFPKRLDYARHIGAESVEADISVMNISDTIYEWEYAEEYELHNIRLQHVYLLYEYSELLELYKDKEVENKPSKQDISEKYRAVVENTKKIEKIEHKVDSLKKAHSIYCYVYDCELKVKTKFPDGYIINDTYLLHAYINEQKEILLIK